VDIPRGIPAFGALHFRFLSQSQSRGRISARELGSTAKIKIRPAPTDHPFGIELIEQAGQLSHGYARLGSEIALLASVSPRTVGEDEAMREGQIAARPAVWTRPSIAKPTHFRLRRTTATV
jgi:hypothetical protein